MSWNVSSWLVLYLTAELLSCMSCLAVVFKLTRSYRAVDSGVQTSTVFWVLLFFFAHLGACFGFGVLYVLQVLVNSELKTRYGHLALMENSENGTNVTKWSVIVVIVLGDVTMIGFSLWFFAMAHEMTVLADKTMDRGATREQEITKRYVVGIHTVLLVFAGVEFAIVAVNGGYNHDGVSSVTYIGFLVQFSGIAYLTIQICRLIYKGRHMESVQGQLVLSPLFLRIRNIMILFILASLQGLLGPISDANWVYHINGVVFRLSGVFLALLVGCSQEWIIDIFEDYLPQDYVARFRTPMLISCVEKLDPPERDPVFVFTDIESSSDLWAIENGAIMRQANELHDDILRSQLLEFNGYEITTAGDAFQLAFRTIEEAVKYCVAVQFQLLQAKWPKQLRRCGVPGAARERVKGKTILEGLRVRMGIHDAQEEEEGRLVCSTHPVTGKKFYTGLSQVIADKVGDLGHGGQIVMTRRVAEWVEAHPNDLEMQCRVEMLRSYFLTSVKWSIEVYQLVINDLEPRVEVFRRAPPRKLASCNELLDDESDCEVPV